MVFGSESNLIIFLMIALIVLFVYHRQIKLAGSDSQSDPRGDKQNSADQNCVQDELSDESSEREGFRNTSERKHKKRSKRTNHHASDRSDLYPNMSVDDALNVLTKSKRGSKVRSRHSAKDSQVEVNTEFTEMQYHKDYNDTITAINNLTPQKELFNMGFLPVKEVTPDQGNIKDLVNLFMKKLNNEIKSNVQEYLHVNSGWNDMGKRRREKSGFEEQMEELGLPGSMYNEPAAKAAAKLVRIDKSEQFNTEDQIRFVAYIIIQKPNVQDQMVLKVQFFLEREDLKAGRDDRANFFSNGLSKNDDKDTKIDPEQVVIIEQVFTLGYLTDQTKKKTKMDKFHDYDNVQRTDGTIDQEKVIKMMLKKHKERSAELNSFVSTLDPETQEQIHDIPEGEYSLYKNTRTIMDDLACFPQKSFGDRTL